MALIKCPECGGQVSDQALTCPHCGYQVQKTEKNQAPANEGLKQESSPSEQGGEVRHNNKSKGGIGCLIAVVAVIFIVMIISVSASKNHKDPSPEDMAFTYATMYIHDQYFTDAKLTQRDATITHSGNLYVVEGKFTRKGVVYHYSIDMTMHDDYATVTSGRVY